jgi:hypothetical protein
VSIEFEVLTVRIFRTVLKIMSGSMGVTVALDLVDALVNNEKGDVDKRIAKIELARENLLEALCAIDEIKMSAQQHKKELAEIRDSVAEIGKERDQLSADKELLVQMTATEKDRLREMLGVPTRLQASLIWIGTFIFGCLTTWAVTYAYDAKIKALMQGWQTAVGG